MRQILSIPKTLDSRLLVYFRTQERTTCNTHKHTQTYVKERNENPDHHLFLCPHHSLSSFRAHTPQPKSKARREIPVQRGSAGLTPCCAKCAILIYSSKQDPIPNTCTSVPNTSRRQLFVADGTRSTNPKERRHGQGGVDLCMRCLPLRLSKVIATLQKSTED